MANITFRLPGREQYSYAEVSVTNDEIDGPDGQGLLASLLSDALAALNLTYPEAERPVAPVAVLAPAAAPQVAPADGLSCIHGVRKHSKGISGAGTPKQREWQALFCPQPKGAAGSCDPKWLKQGEPGWQW
jgi:hypothetical protein